VTSYWREGELSDNQSVSKKTSAMAQAWPVGVVKNIVSNEQA